MNHLKGFRLHVLLSASQTRRRLRGYGFGVRKVQSAGRGEAVIVHTATGQHRRELEALFRDVLKSDATPPPEVLVRLPPAERGQDERD